MKKILLTVGLIIIIVIAGIGIYLKFFLPNIAAAPNIQIEYTAERIANGEYLANHVAVCMDCHSTRDWTKFSGPLIPSSLGKGGEYFGPEMGFPGKYYSKNLTPFNLGNWTDGEIFRAITTGVDKDGKALFPVMPYPLYRSMDKEDIYDLIAYIRQLPELENKTPDAQSNFPMNFIINTFPEEAALTQRPDPSDQINYGKYLINMAGCRDCHTEYNNGKSNLKMAFAGGRKFKFPNGSVNSANITPDPETGIGDWSEEGFLSRFQMYLEEKNTPDISPEQLNTIMPWTMYADMKESDLKAMFAYLKSLKPIKNKVEHFIEEEKP